MRGHEWAVADLSKEVTVIPKCVAHENVVVIGVHLSVAICVDIRRYYGKYLCKSPCHSLPKLVTAKQIDFRPDDLFLVVQNVWTNRGTQTHVSLLDVENLV